MSRRKKPVVLVPLREHHGAVGTAEDRLIARETVALLAASTTPERWRCVRAWANGVPIAEIARRERIAEASVYNRIRLARRDFAAALARAKS